MTLENWCFWPDNGENRPIFRLFDPGQGFRAPRAPHPSGQSPAMALRLRRPEHPGSPSRCQNLKRDKLLEKSVYSKYENDHQGNPFHHF